MIPKKERLGRSEFGHVLSRGLRVQSAHVSATYFQGFNTGKKISFVVSKKIAKTAVLRNTLRRRGYEIIQKVLPSSLVSLRIIFFYKKGAEILPYRALREEICSIVESIPKK